MSIDTEAQRQRVFHWNIPGQATAPASSFSAHDKLTMLGAPVFYEADTFAPVVDVAFDTALLAQPAAGDWTEITNVVRHRGGIKTKRGRSRNLGAFEAATCSFEVDNRDRSFEPNNAASPYGATGVRPMRHVRVRMRHYATDLSVTESCSFRGFVRSWPGSYPHAGMDAVTKVDCSDFFGVLAKAGFDLDSSGAVTAAGDADHEFLMTETSGTVATDSGTNPINGTYAGGVTLDDYAFQAIDPDAKSPAFDGVDGEVQFAANAEWGQTGAVSIEFWIKIDSAPTAPSNGFQATIFEVADPAEIYTHIAHAAGVNTDGDLQVRHGGFRATISGNVADGVAHHGVLTRSAGLVWNCYLDGELTSASPLDGSADAAGAGTQLVLGGEGHVGGSSMFFDGNIGGVRIWNRELSAGEAAALYASSPLNRPAERTDQRITAILDALGIPSSLQSVQQGQSMVQAQTITDSSGALSALRNAADVEAGQLFINCDGVVTFQDRYWRSEQSPIGTFGDDPAELPFSDIVLDYHIERVSNEILVTRAASDGDSPTQQVATDTESQTAYGRRSLSFSGLDFEDDAAAGVYADAMLNRHKDPDLVTDRLEVRPLKDPDTLFPVVLGADISSRVVVNWRPDGGDPITQDSFIESVDETITADNYTVTWRLSPANRQAIWLLDSGALDETTRLAW